MPQKVSGVYTITNTVNGKIYVGESINVFQKLRVHRSDLKANRHTNNRLQNSFNKYGIKNFKFELLEEHNPEFIKSFENYWANLLNSHNPKFGFNLKSCDPYNQGKHSKNTKEKIGKKASVRLKDPKDNPFYGKKHTNEVKALISQHNKGWKMSDKHKKIMSQTAKNRCGASHPDSIKVLNTDTGKVYDSIKIAAKEENINYNMFH